MENDKIYRKLAFLFEDKSMPSMVLLDGKWGSGKSYYLKNKLIPFLTAQKEKKVVSFSLYGISSIDDFRDKLISVCILQNKNTTGMLDKLAGSIIGATGFANSDNSSSLLTIFNGLKGVAKHSILTKLEMFTLILDDLERVDDIQLIKEILGECLQLAENNKVEVIIAANSEAIEGLDGTLDKCISDKITFSLSHSDIIKIAFEETYEKIPPENISKTLESAQKLQIINIRILKRCAKRISEMISEILKRPDIDAVISANILIPQIVSITNAHYQLGYSCEDIKKNIAQKQNLFYLENSNKELTEYEKKTKKTFQLAEYSTDDIIEYSCGEKFSASEITDFGKLPLKASLLDTLNFGGAGQLSEAEMLKACSELKAYLTEKVEVDCYRWFSCLDTLNHLIEKRYIDKPEFIGESIIIFIEKRLKTVKFTPQSTKQVRLRSLISDDIQKQMIKHIEIAREKDINYEISDFKTKMFQSWSNVDLEAYSNYEHKPFLSIIGFEKSFECLMNWNHKDISLFSNFMESRYNFKNIRDYFLEELQDIIYLNGKLKKLNSERKPSLNSGALFELHSILLSIEKRLSK